MVLLRNSFCFGLANPTLSIDFSFLGYFIRIPFLLHDRCLITGLSLSALVAK